MTNRSRTVDFVVYRPAGGAGQRKTRRLRLGGKLKFVHSASGYCGNDGLERLSDMEFQHLCGPVVLQSDSQPRPPMMPIRIWTKKQVMPSLSKAGCRYESNAELLSSLSPPHCTFGKMGILIKIFVTVFDLSCRHSLLSTVVKVVSYT